MNNINDIKKESKTPWEEKFMDNTTPYDKTLRDTKRIKAEVYSMIDSLERMVKECARHNLECSNLYVQLEKFNAVYDEMEVKIKSLNDEVLEYEQLRD